MTAKSTFSGMDRALRQKAYDYLRELGVHVPSNNTLNRYVSREAQRDGDPAVTWEEATAAIDAYASGAPFTRLPGSNTDLSFQLEDGTNVWGGTDYKSVESWKRLIQNEANYYGVAVKF